MTERKPGSVVDISMDRSTDADERPVHNQSPAPARRSESHAPPRRPSFLLDA